MSRWKRIHCLVGRHDARQGISFQPGLGVNVTVTSSRARCLRCGKMVTLVSEPNRLDGGT